MIAESTTSSLQKPSAQTALIQQDFSVVLDAYQNLLETGPSTEPSLRQALEHVLAHPGSLVRAQLAYRILAARSIEQSRALAVAIAIEYFHTASLIFDDMPAMDDASERRGSPCVHVLFGEATATLAALAFVNRGYALLWGSVGNLPDAARLVTTCLGAQGILNGQSRDLRFHTSPRRERDVMEVAEGKTVTLIRLTLLLPALVGGATTREQSLLEELATLWGLSYQIMDDFKDVLMASGETGKTAERDALLQRPNLPAAIGSEAACLRLNNLMSEARSVVERLQASDSNWAVLGQLQRVLDRDQSRVRSCLSFAAA